MLSINKKIIIIVFKNNLLAVRSYKLWNCRYFLHEYKGCGCGQSTQYFSLRKILIAKQLAVWWLEHTGESLIIAITTKIFFFIIYWLSISFKGLSPVLTNFALAHKQQRCLCLINCNKHRLSWALPKPTSL